MLRFYILILIFILGACAKQVQTDYFEEKDVTRFTTKPFKTEYRSREIELEAIKECPGKVICKEQEIKLIGLRIEMFHMTRL